MSGQLVSDVSRETREKLAHYVALLERWNPRINLVAPSTIVSAWTRHVEDSLQLIQLAPRSARSWVDLGSGGGFPGLVIAIAAQGEGRDLRVTLIESDQRKAAFLRTVLRETETRADVRAERIETCAPLAADIVSARALAPLDVLLGLVARHIAPSGLALLPKGARWKEERDAALDHWSCSLHTHRSITGPNAVILQIGDIAHV